MNKKPNVIYILADDMGYGDISAFNENCPFTTPNFDAMCENGLRFVQNTFGEDQELWILLHGLQHTRAAEALQKDPTTLCARLLTQATPAAQAAALRTELQRQ